MQALRVFDICANRTEWIYTFTRRRLQTDPVLEERKREWESKRVTRMWKLKNVHEGAAPSHAFSEWSSDNILSTNINYQRKNFQTITQSKHMREGRKYTQKLKPEALKLSYAAKAGVCLNVTIGSLVAIELSLLGSNNEPKTCNWANQIKLYGCVALSLPLSLYLCIRKYLQRSCNNNHSRNDEITRSMYFHRMWRRENERGVCDVQCRQETQLSTHNTHLFKLCENIAQRHMKSV